MSRVICLESKRYSPKSKIIIYAFSTFSCFSPKRSKWDLLLNSHGVLKIPLSLFPNLFMSQKYSGSSLSQCTFFILSSKSVLPEVAFGDHFSWLLRDFTVLGPPFFAHTPWKTKTHAGNLFLFSFWLFLNEALSWRMSGKQNSYLLH